MLTQRIVWRILRDEPEGVFPGVTNSGHTEFVMLAWLANDHT